ncbi:MAG: hypothetical protein JXA57_18565 [Armatimonadetes bacterium]|nr:hypothetical protein [Armatimonadota bacterium]
MHARIGWLSLVGLSLFGLSGCISSIKERDTGRQLLKGNRPPCSTTKSVRVMGFGAYRYCLADGRSGPRNPLSILPYVDSVLVYDSKQRSIRTAPWIDCIVASGDTMRRCSFGFVHYFFPEYRENWDKLRKDLPVEDVFHLLGVPSFITVQRADGHGFILSLCAENSFTDSRSACRIALSETLSQKTKVYDYPFSRVLFSDGKLVGFQKRDPSYSSYGDFRADVAASLAGFGLNVVQDDVASDDSQGYADYYIDGNIVPRLTSSHTGWVLYDVFLAVPAVILLIPLAFPRELALAISIRNAQGKIVAFKAQDIDLLDFGLSVWGLIAVNGIFFDDVGQACAFVAAEMIQELEDR